MLFKKKFPWLTIKTPNLAKIQNSRTLFLSMNKKNNPASNDKRGSPSVSAKRVPPNEPSPRHAIHKRRMGDHQDATRAGPSHGKSHIVRHARFQDSGPAMEFIPRTSGIDGNLPSGINADSGVRHLLPTTQKRHSTHMPHFKACQESGRIDLAKEIGEEVLVGMEEPEKGPRDLLAAIRTLPVRMKEKRDYRNELLKAVDAPVGERLYFDAFFHKVKTKVPDLYKHVSSKTEIWSGAFKVIEGRFGTGVVSYFVFLRWLLLMNVIIFITSIIFIVLPHVLSSSSGKTPNITLIPEKDIFITNTYVSLPPPSEYSTSQKNSVPLDQNSLSDISLLSKLDIDTETLDNLGSLLNTYGTKGFIDSSLRYSSKQYTFEMRTRISDICAYRYEQYIENTTAETIIARVQDLFQGTGWLEFTVLFMGYYEPYDLFFNNVTYNLPVAFLVVLFILLMVSVVMMLLYASKGVQESMLERNLREMYCYIVFCGWDNCIEEEKMAKRHQGGIFQELTCTLAECRRKVKIGKWTTRDKAKIFVFRCLVHLLTLLSLVGAYFLIFYVAKVQLEAERTSSNEGASDLFIKFLPSLTITILNFIIPLFLFIFAQFEEYQIRTQISVDLVRIIFLRQASTIILLSSFYNQITCEPRDMCHKGEGTCPSPICWETYVGQQMYRLAVLDLIVHICIVFFWETPRNYAVVKWKNRFIQYVGKQIFDIPTQVLSLVYSQTLCWLGMFYCPLLPAITVSKFIIFFYIKKFTVLQNCAPQQIPYKASRSNAIFVLVLMLSFFVTIAVLGYSVAQITPSPGCSPYRLYDHMMHAVSNAMQSWSPEFNKIAMFVFSPLCVVPMVILLCLTLYYYVTKASAHKSMVKLLKVQLTMEGKDKQFLLNRVTKIKPKLDGSQM